MSRKETFFGRLVAATDILVLLAAYVLAYRVRLKLWQLGYPVLPIGSLRKSTWIITVMLPAWLYAHYIFSLYNPVIYRSTYRVLRGLCKAQVLASVLMLNAVFIIRGFDGVSRPLLALLVIFSFAGLLLEKLIMLLAMRSRWRLQRRSAVWRVLLVGSHSDASNYTALVREHPEWNLEIVDIIPASHDGSAMRQ